MFCRKEVVLMKRKIQKAISVIPAAARLMLAGEGHTAETAAYIDGIEIKGNADDFFRAFPHRPTRFCDCNWMV